MNKFCTLLVFGVGVALWTYTRLFTSFRMRNVSIFVDSGQQMPSRLPNESTLARIHSHKQLQLNRFLTLSHMNGTACFLCLLFSYSSYWIQFNESDACESSFSVCMRAVLYCPLRVDFELFILSVDRLAGVHVKASFVYFDNILILRSTTPYHTIPWLWPLNFSKVTGFAYIIQNCLIDSLTDWQTHHPTFALFAM